MAEPISKPSGAGFIYFRPTALPRGNLIVTFLQSLTGTVDKTYIQEPQLPPSSATTPKTNPN